MFSRICLLADHQEKEIDNVCIFPNCQFSRFLCSKCLKLGIHKHEQQNNSHILDHEEFYEKFMNKINQIKDQGQRICKNSAESLKMIIQEISNQVKNMINLIEQERSSNNNQYLLTELIKIKKNGFTQINEQALNNIINMNNQQKDIGYIHQQLELQTNIIIENVQKVKEWSQNIDKDVQRVKVIQNLKHQIIELFETKNKWVLSSAISNDLKYVVAGREDKSFNIWYFENCQMIKQLQFDYKIFGSKFTNDSTLLYVGDADGQLHQIDVNDKFKLIQKLKIHEQLISNIICISNSIILTSSNDNTIVNTDIKLKQKLFTLQAHTDLIPGLDYHRNSNVIVSGSFDQSIKLWNCKNGQIIIEKQNAHNNSKPILQVIFAQNKNQLISLSDNNTIIWKINYESKQLEVLKTINEKCSNISYVFDEQYILQVGNLKIRYYSIEGELIREIDHKIFYDGYFNTVQPQSMRAILIRGACELQICKIESK